MNGPLSPGFVIERATPELAAALSRIAVAAKAHWGYPDSWLRSWSEQLTVTVDYIAANPTYLARVGTALAGFCAITVEGSAAQLDHLWVDPCAMGRGIGRALFSRAEAVAIGLGVNRLRIVSDPHAEEFYLRMGAVKCGTEAAPVEGHSRILPVLTKEFSRRRE